jgi:pyridoxine 5-phosphate synthase
MAAAAAECGCDRVELYTENYARKYAAGLAQEAISPYLATALEAQKAGLGVNAGHDLSLDNLGYFIENIPFVAEVSIGHALISEALYLGLETTIQRYLDILRKK